MISVTKLQLHSLFIHQCHETCLYLPLSRGMITNMLSIQIVTNSCGTFFVQDCPIVLMSGTEIPLYIYDYMLQCILITCYYFIYVDIEFHAECNI